MVTLLLADTPLIGRRHSLQVRIEHILVEVALSSVDVIKAPGELLRLIPQKLDLGSDDFYPFW